MSLRELQLDKNVWYRPKPRGRESSAAPVADQAQRRQDATRNKVQASAIRARNRWEASDMAGIAEVDRRIDWLAR